MRFEHKMEEVSQNGGLYFNLGTIKCFLMPLETNNQEM
jgi:hypothetical protein